MFITNTIHIEAPPDTVWKVLVDVESWPAFAGQFKSIVCVDDGPLGMGSSARVTPHGFFGSVWTVTRFEPGRSFLWESSMLPGLHLAGDHAVEPEGSGSKVMVSLESTGPLAAVLNPVLGRIFRRNVRTEAEGLKAHIEHLV